MSSPAAGQSGVEQRAVEINFQPSAVTARRIINVALGVPTVGGIIAIAVVLFLAYKRIPYPYELDWLESGMLEHVRRLVHDQPIYTAPSVNFTQYPYAPLSFGVGAIFATVFGTHFWVLRAISFASSLGVFTLIYLIVRKETRNNWAAFISVGVFAASCKLSGAWFDVGKADDLFLLITLGAIAVARSAGSRKSAMWAGFLMALAVLTKQTAIFAFIPIAIYLIATRRRVGIYFTVSTLVVGGVATFILNVISHGWFDYFVWELLFQHQLESNNVTDFITKDMFPFWPVAILVVMAAPRLLRTKRLWASGFYAFALAGLVAGSWTSRLHSGGSFNVLLPAFAAAAIALGIALGTMLLRPQRLILILVAVVLCTMQLAWLRYDPAKLVPSSTDQAAGDNFINWLKTINGNVFIYSHPTYAVMAGHPSFVSQGGSEDVLRGTTLNVQADFERSLAGAIHNYRFAAIILDGPDDTRGFPSDWQSYYVQLPGKAVPNDNAFRPINLLTGHPTEVFVPVGTGSALTLPAQ